MTMSGYERRVVGFETIAVSNAAGGIGPISGSAVTSGTTAAFFGPVETNSIRWRADGTAPSATVGHLLQSGQTLYLEGDAVRKILFIRVSADSALPVTYYE